MYLKDYFKYTRFMINVCEIKQLKAFTNFEIKKKDLDPK